MKTSKTDTQDDINNLFDKYLKLSNYGFCFFVLFFIALFIKTYKFLHIDAGIVLTIVCGIFLLLFIILFLRSYKYRYLLYRKMNTDAEYRDQVGFWIFGIFFYPMWYFYNRVKIIKDVKKYFLPIY